MITYLEFRTKAYLGEIAVAAIGLQTPKIGTTDRNRMTAILERLNWERKPKDGDGKIPWGKRK